MNYLFRLDDGECNEDGIGTFVFHGKLDASIRPSKGSQLVLPISTKTWRVVRVDPPSNPSNQQNTYFIEESGPLPRHTALRSNPFSSRNI